MLQHNHFEYTTNSSEIVNILPKRKEVHQAALCRNGSEILDEWGLVGEV